MTSSQTLASLEDILVTYIGATEADGIQIYADDVFIIASIIDRPDIRQAAIRHGGQEWSMDPSHQPSEDPSGAYPGGSVF